MTIFNAALIYLVIVALLGVIVYLIRQLITSKDVQIKALQDEFEILIERKRQTGSTMAGIEDIQAALTRIKHDRNYQDELLDASLRTLGQIRKGPYAYDPNTPCVSRKDKK